MTSSDLFKASSYSLWISLCCLPEPGGNTGAWSSSSANGQHSLPVLGYAGNGHPHQICLAWAAHASETFWHRQAQRPDKGKNAAKGVDVKKSDSNPRTLCCPIFHIPGNSSAGPSLPHLRFNSWLDSTSLLCCQLLLLSWCLQYTTFFFPYCFNFSSQILLVRWWKWRVLTYADLRAQFWEVGC